MGGGYREFLEVLFGAKEDEQGFILLWRSAGRRSSWFKSASGAADWLDKQKDRRNIYVGVGLSPSQMGVHQRCKQAEVSGVVGVWADIDVLHPCHKKKNLPPDRESAMQLLKNTGKRPTIVLESGHGLQAWWVLTEPVFFDSEEERRAAHQSCWSWQEYLKQHAAALGWEIDSTPDISRVLRVPGTINHKPPHPPVDSVLIEAYGPKYDLLSDFEMATTRPDDRPAPIEVTGGGFLLSEDAQPPLTKLEVMEEIYGKRWRQTMERKRTDFKDSSGSSYCFSLAQMCIQAEWSDQEVVNLLIYWRRKHGEDLKLDRPDWYGKHTIQKARTAVGRKMRMDGAIEALTGEQADSTRNNDILKHLGTLFGFPVWGIEKHGLEKSVYWMRVGPGKKAVEIGPAKQALSVAHVRNVFVDQFSAVLHEDITPKKWTQLWRMKLSKIVEDVDPDLNNPDEELRDWLEEYLRRTTVAHESSEEGVQNALRLNGPFVRDESDDPPSVWVHAGTLATWLRDVKGLMVDGVPARLATFGFTRKTVYLPGTSRSYYWNEASKFKALQPDQEQHGSGG